MCSAVFEVKKLRCEDCGADEMFYHTRKREEINLLKKWAETRPLPMTAIKMNRRQGLICLECWKQFRILRLPGSPDIRKVLLKKRIAQSPRAMERIQQI